MEQIVTITQAPIVRRAGEGPSHNILGATHVYKLLATETAGAAAVWEATMPPGTAVPAHVHSSEDEAFYVLEGELTMQLDGKDLPPVRAGSFVFAPRNIPHGFRNDGAAPTRLLVFAMPGKAAFEMFAQMDEAIRNAWPNTPFEQIATITARHGVAFA